MTMNGASLVNFTNSHKEEICESYVYLGRTNDYVEGFDELLKSLEGVGAHMKRLVVPKYQSALPGRRVLTDVTRLNIDVLSDNEKNAVELNQIDNSVKTRHVIDVKFLNVKNSLIHLFSLLLAGLSASFLI